MQNQNLKFDKKFFQDFWHLLKPYWTSDEKWIAFGLLFMNVVCVFGGVRVSVGMNNFNRDFYNALQTFNKAGIVTAMWHYLVLFALLILSFGYSIYFNGLVNIRWRRWLTKTYLQKWLSNHTHYRMQVLNNNVDNPDQRISEDLEQFTGTTLSIFFMLMQSILTIVSFGIILWNLSGSISIPLGSWHITVPGYLCWIAFLYAVLGTWLIGKIGKAIAFLNYQQQQYNADFRFSLVRLRESSEQIALYRGETVEDDQFHGLFRRIVDNFLKMITMQKRLMFFSNGYNTLSHVFGLLCSMPLYLAKKIQLGGVMQISGAFGSVVSSFSVFINTFYMLAEWRAVIHRLTEFARSMNVVNQTVESKIKIREHNNNDIFIEDLHLKLPGDKFLVEKINLTFSSGKSILLSGVSGFGKSILMRALAGIWPYGEGQIYFPQNKQILFLPQKPYLPLGSLRGVLLYPNNKRTIRDEDLYEIMDTLGLKKFKDRLNEVKDWSHELSLGEQQLIAFARIFLCKPDIIFLDEATSSLDENAEINAYKNMREILPAATIVSIGHRMSLRNLHDKLIHLSKDVSNIASYANNPHELAL